MTSKTKDPRMSNLLDRAQLFGFLIVALTMVEMFSIPPSYFVLGSIVSTLCMLLVALILTKYDQLFRPSTKSLVIGAASAAILYAIFYAGNFLIKVTQVPGVSAANETSIYSLIKKGPLELQLVILFLDALGFESYFRGTLMNYFQIRMGIWSVFLVAAIDAIIHISTFNPLFPPTTFIADSIWGLVYYRTKDLSSSITSHFLWDIAIFVLLPIS